ncbi:hypothetical protein B5X24_HaOG200934 [Helicoverpa armigera]|nr:hypothetical protein B5X24_HaOG200934 [Helicoverpa armigera]
MFFLVMFYSIVSAGAFLTTDHENIESLTNCVVKIIKKVDYNRYTKVVDVTLMNIKNDIKLSALHNLTGVRFVSRRFFWNTNDLSNKYYLVMSEDFQELEEGLKEVTSDIFWNPLAGFIIVLKSHKHHSSHDITDLLHTYNIFFASLILHKDDKYFIYKYNFTASNRCYKAGHLTLWASCSDFCSEKQLPILIEGNIRNCQYKFISRNLWPFTNFDTAFKGTEQWFVALFEKQYGVKIDLKKFGKIDKCETITYDTKYIMLKKVENNEVEGAVGGYSITEEYSGNVSHSYPISIDYMYYILPHKKYVGPLVAVLHGSTGTFVLIGLLFVIFCIAAKFLSIFAAQKDFSQDVLMVFGYLLNKCSANRISAGWPQAIVFSSLLFTSFIFPYAIQANLYSVTTEPVRGQEPKTSQDLKNYKAVLYTDFQYRHNKEFSGYLDCGNRINCLMLVKNCPDKSCYTVMTSAHYFANLWQLTDDECKMTTYILREPYITSLRTIYLRRGSVLIRPIKEFLLRIINSGVLSKYSRDLYIREWLKRKCHHRSEHVPLSMSSTYYVFMMLIAGYCLSVITFICEFMARSQIIIRRRT